MSTVSLLLSARKKWGVQHNVVYSTFILDLFERIRIWSWSVSRCAGGPFVVCIQPVLNNSVSVCYQRRVCLQRWVEDWQTGEELLNQPLAHRADNIIFPALQNLRMVGSGRQLWRSSPIFPRTNRTEQTKQTPNQKNSQTKEKPLPPVSLLPGIPFHLRRQWDFGRSRVGICCWCCAAGGGARPPAQLGGGKWGGSQDEVSPPVYSMAATARGEEFLGLFVF